MRIRFERLGRTGFVVTDVARPWRTLVLYQDRDPSAFAALRELELDMASVTPVREQRLHGVIHEAWALRDQLFSRPALPARRHAA